MLNSSPLPLNTRKVRFGTVKWLYEARQQHEKAEDPTQSTTDALHIDKALLIPACSHRPHHKKPQYEECVGIRFNIPFRDKFHKYICIYTYC